jgi:transcriptional regulator with XRE-family HTH domain
MVTFGEFVRQRRKDLGLSQQQLADATHYSKPAIGKIERGETAAPGRLEILAQVLQVEVSYLKRLADEAAVEQDKPSKRQITADMSFDYSTGSKRAAGFKPDITPGRDLVGHRNLPIYAAAMGGMGHQIVTFDAIDYVKRPSVLEAVKDAYGIYIVGDSMIPAFRPGDLALVHPHLPPAHGADVVLYHGTQDHEVECIIKHLTRYSDSTWYLEQFNPLMTLQESRADWPICHRVVGKYSAR